MAAINRDFFAGIVLIRLRNTLAKMRKSPGSMALTRIKPMNSHCLGHFFWRALRGCAGDAA
ncbi:hypothetical protein RIN58_16645 [Siccibacter colletis]|uniref:hypothetical protein n=1 Tax=Siccibacter colletis TaxID=1505757 RepID=UPI0028BE4E29|nr:hypothetical protein [Siccibacter colletis]WNN47982.1 hypothetical protein RIN58_16645 [Siccibacter colletis]